MIFERLLQVGSLEVEENIRNKLKDCLLLEGGLEKEDKVGEGSLDQNLEILWK